MRALGFPALETEAPAGKDWTLLRRRNVYEAPPWLSHWVEEYALPGGTIISDFHAIEMRDFVVIAAFSADQRIVAERAYRPGAKAVCLVLPAGYIEAGEPPLAAAQRELREETGYEAPNWREIGSFVVDGNRGCGTMHAFAAIGAVRVCEPDSGDNGEIEVLLLDPKELLSEVLSSQVPHTLPCVATLALALSGTAPALNGGLEAGSR